MTTNYASTFIGPRDKVHAGVEGYAYGVPLCQRNARTGKQRVWLDIPSSDYGTHLYETTEGADNALMRACSGATLNDSKMWQVKHVRSVFRYGWNWFEIID